MINVLSLVIYLSTLGVFLYRFYNKTIPPFIFGHFSVTLAGHYGGFVLIVEVQCQPPITPPQYFICALFHPFLKHFGNASFQTVSVVVKQSENEIVI
jgi:hypothetical protein